MRDEFRFARSSLLQVLFYAAQPVEKLSPGRLAISTRPRRLILEYTPDLLHVSIETVPLEDSELRSNWGQKLYRILFELKDSGAAGSYHFRIVAE